MANLKHPFINSFEDSLTHGGLDGKFFKGNKEAIIGTLEVATSNLGLNDIIALAPLKGSDVVHSIKLFFDDLDSNASPALAFHVGILRTSLTGGDNDVFATAITVAQAASADITGVGKVGYEVRFEAANIDSISKQVFELAGDTVDRGDYYLALTVSTAAATAAAGTISFSIETAN
jgi:hypothetical protein